MGPRADPTNEIKNAGWETAGSSTSQEILEFTKKAALGICK